MLKIATSIDVEARLAVANEMADAARTAILPYFRGAELGTENKDAGGYDPVTIADRAAEEAMRAVLSRRCPEDSILGEEFGMKEGTSGLIWVLDPIDGTRGFVSGTPTWGVLIALSDANGPVLGVVDQPYIGERFVGSQFGATLTRNNESREIRVRGPRSLSDAIIFTTFPEVGTPKERACFEALAADCKLARYGMDCYAYALLAAGQIDLVVEAGLNSYDIQGPIALVQAAGGVVTNWTGGPAHEGGRAIAAATPQMHAEALKYLENIDD